MIAFSEVKAVVESHWDNLLDGETPNLQLLDEIAESCVPVLRYEVQGDWLSLRTDDQISLTEMWDGDVEGLMRANLFYYYRNLVYTAYNQLAEEKEKGTQNV